MSRGALSPLVLVLLVVVSAVTTAPSYCPFRGLCTKLCQLSPRAVKLVARCEVCHPGVCAGGGKESRPKPTSARRGFGPPKSKSSTPDNESKPETRVVPLGAPESKPSAPENDAVQKPAVSKAPDDFVENNNNRDVYHSVEEESIDVDGAPSTTQATDLKEGVGEEDDEDIPNEGSGALDEENPEPVESDAGPEDEATEDVTESSAAEATPEEREPKEREPGNDKAEEADTEQPEQEKQETEQPGSEAPEPSEPEKEEPKVEENQPEEKELEDTEPQGDEIEETLPQPELEEAEPEAKPAAKPTAKPETKPATKSETRPEVRPVAKPAATPVAKPAVEPVAKPAARPAVKPVTKPAAKPADKPVAKPVAQPEAEPAAKPVAKPAAKPAANPAAKPIAKPATKPIAKPAAEPAAKPAAKPAANPAARPAAKPAAGPAAKPEAEPETEPEEVEPGEAEESGEAEAAEEAADDESEEDAVGGSNSLQPAELPELDVASSESPEENQANEPRPEDKEETFGDSEDSESVTPSSRIFSGADPRSSLACLHNGNYRPLHSTWFDVDHCNLHVCTTGGVQTTSLMGACRDPPENMAQCRRYRLPNQCCYTYECPDGGGGGDGPLQSCLDDHGVERPHNDYWVDDVDHPCVRSFCADGVVVVLSDMRRLCPLPPSHDCIAYQPDGMCCNDFNCTGAPLPHACLDAQGNVRDHRQIWYDNDVITCRKYLCNNGTVQLLKDDTETCPDPGPGCVPVPVSGQCCPTLTNCSCVWNGDEYPHGAVFPDDPAHPCRRLQCDNGTIVTLDERQCRPLSCSSTYRRPGFCCYECVGCVHDGIHRPEGSFWYDDPQRSCVLFTCSNSHVVEVNRTKCSEAPGPGCQPVYTPGVCCPMYECPGVTCPYGDQIYQEGDIWVDDPVHPCKWFICRRTGVQQINNTYCPELVPPHCPTERDPGECCYSCRTVITLPCFYQGQVYPEGSVWADNPVYPCRWYTCRQSVVQQVNNTYCPPLVPPDCPTERDPGECCYRCETTGGGSECIDRNGNARESGELYYTDQERCMLAHCVGEEQVIVLDRTSGCPTPPHANCSVVGYSNCCPQYLCHLMPISNCTDGSGRKRKDGEIYANDPEGCLLVQCVDGEEKLIVDRSTLCPPPDHDLTNCQQIGTEDCCPVHHCTNPVNNCVDNSGTPRADGDMYYVDPEGCVLVECTDGEEVTIVDRTEDCSPPPDNPACIVLGRLDCCPIHSCPDCTYNNTTHPIDALWWDDPLKQCIRYRCSSQGLVEQVPEETHPPCARVRFGCVPIREEPACCHHKYNCMFDYEHNLLPMQ